MTTVPLAAQFSLAGARAFVTGGSGFLGAATCRALAAAGALVAVGGRDAVRSEAVVGQLREAGGDGFAVVGDLCDPAGVESARRTIQDRWGGLDILVNAAGGHVPGALVSPEGGVEGVGLDAFREVLDLNATSTLAVIQAMLPLLRAPGRLATASVVNFGSMSADRALTRALGYGASKAAVTNLTRWLACELAGGERPVRVNAIAPGFILTPANHALMLDGDQLTGRGQTVVARTPMGRFGEPDEIGGAVAFLCMPAASFITGEVLAADGGFSAWSGV